MAVLVNIYTPMKCENPDCKEYLEFGKLQYYAMSDEYAGTCLHCGLTQKWTSTYLHKNLGRKK
jgi:hypothetical protein